jgi:hypothetical protein
MLLATVLGSGGGFDFSSTARTSLTGALPLPLDSVLGQESQIQWPQRWQVDTSRGLFLSHCGREVSHVGASEGVRGTYWELGEGIKAFLAAFPVSFSLYWRHRLICFDGRWSSERSSPSFRWRSLSTRKATREIREVNSLTPSRFNFESSFSFLNWWQCRSPLFEFVSFKVDIQCYLVKLKREKRLRTYT